MDKFLPSAIRTARAAGEAFQQARDYMDDARNDYLGMKDLWVRAARNSHHHGIKMLKLARREWGTDLRIASLTGPREAA